ncbi:uncharacterized protein BDZ83DRAFT_406228 [Colletotrichum acutatum]|uniref:Uncharacterized protein n=1 Tax=Glomerella acutata TaxID=27357 RepID=A0AAD8UFR3_GLOAC|nr:uncharacterized protein BDZ83DRAFT_406228 [Colletotrichum acutatum]KAK1723096.1 hypothetical protein BDZ83DRAFT_406228 [Colletotrichum acutatum]
MFVYQNEHRRIPPGSLPVRSFLGHPLTTIPPHDADTLTPPRSKKNAVHPRPGQAVTSKSWMDGGSTRPTTHTHLNVRTKRDCNSRHNQDNCPGIRQLPFHNEHGISHSLNRLIVAINVAGLTFAFLPASATSAALDPIAFILTLQTRPLIFAHLEAHADTHGLPLNWCRHQLLASRGPCQMQDCATFSATHLVPVAYSPASTPLPSPRLPHLTACEQSECPSWDYRTTGWNIVCVSRPRGPVMRGTGEHHEAIPLATKLSTVFATFFGKDVLVGIMIPGASGTQDPHIPLEQCDRSPQQYHPLSFSSRDSIMRPGSEALSHLKDLLGPQMPTSYKRG